MEGDNGPGEIRPVSQVDIVGILVDVREWLFVFFAEDIRGELYGQPNNQIFISLISHRLAFGVGIIIALPDLDLTVVLFGAIQEQVGLSIIRQSEDISFIFKHF